MVNREYKQCANCVMDTTDPAITFNEKGVCNHCLKYKEYEDNSKLKGHAAKQFLANKVAKIKQDGKGKDYDCIMGISGGVDSSYLAYYATKILGLRVLLFHVDTGWNSELAVKNIENIVKILNLDLHTLVIDWPEMRDLQRSFFKSSVPNCDIPQDHSFIASMYNESKKYGLKHILNGGNMSTESILPTSWGYDASDWVHIKDIHDRFGEVKLKTYPHIDLFTKSIIYPFIIRLKVHSPLNYIEYNKAETKKFLIENLGWKDYGGKHYESKFTQFFQAHYLPEKFGFDKRLAHLSSLIVSGQMTKSEALVELEKPLYDADELIADKDYFIKKLNFSPPEWETIMKSAPKNETDYTTNRSHRGWKYISKMLSVLYFTIGVSRKILKKVK
jgi:N-acetyl sugar amidotransferase